MDDVLPIPQPDWDNPEPTDAPVPEEVDAYVGLMKLRDGLTPWLARAAGRSLLPVEWRQLMAMLHTAAEKCALADADPVATYVPAQIVIHPHPAVPQRGKCLRCDLPVTDGVHRHAAELDAAINDNQPE